MLLIPFLVIGIGSIYISSKSISEIAKNDLAIIAESLADTVGIGISEQITATRNVAGSNSAIAASEKHFRDGGKNDGIEITQAESELIRIKNNEGDRCSSVNLIDTGGVFFASSNRKANVGINISDRDYFKAAMKGVPNVGTVAISKASGRIVLSTASPVYASNGKDITGVATITMEIAYLTDLIDKVKIGKSGYVVIADKTGLTIAHPDKESILKEDITKVAGKEALAQMVTQGKSGIVEYHRSGVDKTAFVVHEPITGWSIFASIETDELLAPVALTRNMVLAIGLFSIVFAFVLLVFFSRNLTVPIVKLVEAAQRIARGELDFTPSLGTGADEVALLSQSFSRMTSSLRDMADIAERIASGELNVEVKPQSERDLLGNALARMVENLRGANKELRSGIDVLAASSSEILATVSQVAASASETATAVSETSTTAEEVKQTAHLANQKARLVQEGAQRSALVSETGRRAVIETIEGMDRIREQMESIAESVVRLSEQGQAIGEIIATVNDLAEQSNLLAVNAAIEASRAGEYGRGFTVVAQEVKSLAEQSRQATTQVRTILMEVQKATSAAVLATEQGSKVVVAGAAQAASAGESIQALTTSVGEASQAAMQIAASSQQQLVGMDQIALAIANIQEATTQNMAGTRQLEDSAHGLSELGTRLKTLIERQQI
ncbi:MAG TPA: methyl-accepting chemotaxis protein [Rectinemataceae bacterium]|nr:methyl-accepting chemotaxis protein [Rectinemataceae bacterium]